MTKEDLLFRLETFKGQLETFETALRRSVTTGTVDKETLEKEIMKLNRNYLPLREYISHFVGGHHFATALWGEGLSGARLNSIGSCIRDVSITSAQIARMNDREFASFTKKIQYSISRRQKEEQEQKKAIEEGKKIHLRGEQRPAHAPVGAMVMPDRSADMKVIQSQPDAQMTRPTGEEVSKGRGIRVFFIVLAIGLGLFGIMLSVYFSVLQIDSLNAFKENIAARDRQNRRMISRIVSSLEAQTKLVDSVREGLESTSERNNERIGDIATSLTDLEEDFRGIGSSELGGSVYVPLKLGTVSAVLEIDPFLKKGLIKGRDHRTGKEIIKPLDPATTNLIIWELSELKYAVE